MGIIEAMETLSHQKDDPNFGAVVHDITRSLSSGMSLSQTFALYPRIFPRLYVTMARVGENTGNLTNALDSLRIWTEKDEETRQRVKAAFSYPLLVISVAVILTMLLFQTVIPKFMEIFDNLNFELPLITKFVLLLTQLAKNPGSYILLGAGLIVGWISFRKTWSDPARAAAMTRLLMHLPVVGSLIRDAGLARFCNAAEIAIESGLDVLLSIELGCLASENPAMIEQGSTFSSAISDGESISSFMAKDPTLWGTLLPQFVRAGEESASVAPMLGRAQTSYAAKVETAVDNLSTILEPLLLFGVAIVVGTVLLSVFIPLYSVLGTLG